ncbi:MAG: hypothetical protein E6713_05840 [Sporomusaceae bacterium]|nr:hypothetical protein [Sporomusaceae bacterium]
MSFEPEPFEEELFNANTRFMWQQLMLVRNIPECHGTLKKVLPKLVVVGKQEFNEIIRDTYGQLLPYIISYGEAYIVKNEEYL